jgi:hypothetical protein
VRWRKEIRRNEKKGHGWLLDFEWLSLTTFSLFYPNKKVAIPNQLVGDILIP